MRRLSMTTYIGIKVGRGARQMKSLSLVWKTSEFLGGRLRQYTVPFAFLAAAHGTKTQD
jgi:hypothetical protein